MRPVLCTLGVVALTLAACGSANDPGAAQSTSSVARTTVTSVAETTSSSVATTTTEVAVTTTPTVETTTTVGWDKERWITQEGPAAMAVVEEYYRLLNSGDVVAAFDMLVGSGSGNHRTSLRMAVDGTNAQITVDCSASEVQPVITCSETISDDFYGPAGIVLKGRIAYAFAGSEATKLTLRSTGTTACTSESYRGTTYLLALYEWIVVAHPDLESTFTGSLDMGKLGIPCTAYPFVNPELASDVCKVVPEFVAQSDVYPIPTA